MQHESKAKRIFKSTPSTYLLLLVMSFTLLVSSRSIHCSLSNHVYPKQSYPKAETRHLEKKTKAKPAGDEEEKKK